MNNHLLQTAIKTISLQATSIANLSSYINTDFEKVVEAISICSGRLVISGVGKSAIVAQKIVATLNSTGTPSLFMHAADAIHGDLGMIQQQDIVIFPKFFISGIITFISGLSPLLLMSITISCCCIIPKSP